MKTLYTIMILALVTVTASLRAQEDKAARPSPPAEAKTLIGDVMVSINYSAPAVKGRTIWGSLVPYGKVWRTGANEATVFETSADVKINGQALPAGKYALFTIPGETEWTLIFNSVWEQWGAYRYDQSKDVLRVDVEAGKSDSFNERLVFHIKGNKVSLQWENLEVGFVVEP